MKAIETLAMMKLAGTAVKMILFVIGFIAVTYIGCKKYK